MAELFAASTPGLTILAVLGLKALIALFGGAGSGWLQVLDAAGTLALVVALGYLLVRMLNLLQQRFLWRVRRKLVLSYVLIGFVPILLSVVFFVVSGALLLTTVSSSLVQLSFSDVMEDANDLAAMTAVDLGGLVEPAEVRAVLAGRVQAVEERYPDASIAVLWSRRARPAPPAPGRGATTSRRSAVHRLLGALPSWARLDDARDGAPPDAGGARRDGAPGRLDVVARGVARFGRDASWVYRWSRFPSREKSPGACRPLAASRSSISASSRPSAGPGPAPPVRTRRRVRSAPVPVRGRRAPDGAPTLDLPSLPASISSTGPRAAGARRSGLPRASNGVLPRGRRGRRVPLGVFVWDCCARVMFLTIEAAAMVMGFALAGSITGAVHELFTGTERVRQGDLTHRIRVGTEDQLGELAESFNTMTGSIADLMAEAAEKRRLEEELRIARDIQMSLLPEGPASVPGLTVTAACRPAREVGGDYYDFIRLDEHRLGVLVADVSGKGTSAAFYMAELKGVVLSLSRFHQSPRELLIEVNRILSATLDGRTFITMTYAVLDLAARRLTYARAGHTPLVHVPFAPEGPRTPRVLAPDGLVVGLQIDGVEEKFIELIEESSFSLETGDLVALFTDGVTEAMNEESDLFGEERLSRILTEQIHLSSDDLKQRVLGDVEAFAGTAEQHDDMTIVLLRVGDAPSLPPPASRP